MQTKAVVFRHTKKPCTCCTDKHMKHLPRSQVIRRNRLLQSNTSKAT